jgi:hypothetical protein
MSLHVTTPTNDARESSMSPVFTTFLTSLLSTIGVPILEKHFHVTLPATEQTALTAGAVGVATASAHWLHTRLFSRHRHH